MVVFGGVFGRGRTTLSLGELVTITNGFWDNHVIPRISGIPQVPGKWEPLYFREIYWDVHGS